MSDLEDISTGADLSTDQHQKLMFTLNSGDWATAESLINGGANVRQKDSYMDTPLHIVARHGILDLAKTIIGHGADLNAVNSTYHTPLHEALLNKHTKIAELLIESGADVELIIYGEEISPLHLAVRNGELNLVDAILKCGEYVDVETRGCLLPLYMALESGHTSVAKLLINSGADILKTVAVASVLEDFHILKALLDLGTDVNLKDNEGNSFLSLVINNGCPEFGRMLMDAGADVSICNSTGETPLHIACLSGVADIVELIIERGADVNAFDMFLKTPLHIAANKGDIKIMQVLLGKGHEVDCIDNDGNTPLHMAVQSENRECVAVLLDWRASIDIVNNLGKAAFDQENSGHLKSFLDQHLEKISCISKFQTGNYEWENCSEYQMSCFEELKTMKSIKCGALTVSRIFFLSHDPNFAMNDCLEKLVVSAEQHFPIYCNMLKSIFVKGKMRYELLSQVEKYYNLSILRCELKRMIITYLSDADLKSILSFVNEPTSV